MRIGTFVRFGLRADDEPLEVLCSLGGSSVATCRCKSKLDVAAIGASLSQQTECFGFLTHMGASQIRRSGTSSGTTPVPYPRSIPPFHTCLKDPFHTSVPYVIIHTNTYKYTYTYISAWVQCVSLNCFAPLRRCSRYVRASAFSATAPLRCC